MPTTRTNRNWTQDIRRLDNIANAYHNAKCDQIKAMWKKKWYDLCKIIGNNIENDTKH
jgi:hypothetical protein